VYWYEQELDTAFVEFERLPPPQALWPNVVERGEGPGTASDARARVRRQVKPMYRSRMTLGRKTQPGNLSLGAWTVPPAADWESAVRLQLPPAPPVRRSLCRKCAADIAAAR